jgi:hypothetical protein
VSFRLMFWAYAAAAVFTAYNVGKYIVGPGKWRET